MLLTEIEFESLVLGASIYATGGGDSALIQLERFKRLEQGGAQLELVGIDELPENSLIACAYQIGSVAAPQLELSPILKCCLTTLQSLLGQEVRAIFPAETGAESMVFEAAALLGCPVLDADISGGRAVPEVSHDNFWLAGLSVAPIVAVAPKLNRLVLTEVEDGLAAEKRLREFALASAPQTVFALDHATAAGRSRAALNLGSLSRNIRVGASLKNLVGNTQTISNLEKIIGGTLLCEGEVASVELSEAVQPGFLCGSYSIRTEAGDLARVYVKNENIGCLVNKRCRACVPDLLVLVDMRTLQGVNNSELKTGSQVALLSVEASAPWRTRRGRELFGPRYFEELLRALEAA